MWKNKRAGVSAKMPKKAKERQQRLKKEHGGEAGETGNDTRATDEVAITENTT